MKSFKLVPQFRDGCVIQGKDIDDIGVGDTVFLISSMPTKKYSIISKIESIEESEDPKILVDKRILGLFAENDEVTVLRYNPAEALEVHITVSDEYAVLTKGEWTQNIKPSLMDKLIDFGQEITFMIPWEGGAPIIGVGIINTTLPNPPVYIGARTRIFIDKASRADILIVKNEKMEIQESRVDILERQKDQMIFQSVQKIRRENYPNQGQKYEFKNTKPKQLFKSVLNVFKGLDSIEEAVEEKLDDGEQDYFATAVFLVKGETLQLIDVQINATGNSGSLLIWVTGENDQIIAETLDNYDKRISQLKQGLEQKVEIDKIQCPDCGADLPRDKINVEGVVKCIYCRTTSKIPKVLRY